MKKYNELDYERREKFINNITSLMSDYMDFHNITSIDEACEKIGISKSMYHKWKKLTPMQYPTDTLLKLHTAFNTMETVTTDYILGLTDERSPKSKEVNLTKKDIQNKTGLNERVLTALMTPHFNSEYLQLCINYFFDIDTETEKVLNRMYKTYSLKDTEKRDEKLTELQEKLGDIYLKNKKDKNIYFLKKDFIFNVCKYIFNKGFAVTDYRGKNLHSIQLKNKLGLIEDTKTITTDFFSLSYFEDVTYDLKSIKKYYEDNEYDNAMKEDFEAFQKHTFLNLL